MPSLRTFNHIGNTLRRGAGATAKARRNGRLGQTAETAGDIAGAAGSMHLPTSSNPVSATLQTMATGGNLIWVGAEMGLPFGAYITGGSMNLAGKAANKAGQLVGADGAGTRLVQTSESIANFLKRNYTEKALHETRFGYALAGIADRTINPFYKITAAFDKMSGAVTGLANRSFNKAVAHGVNARAHAEAIAEHLPQELGHHLNGLLTAAHSHNALAMDEHGKAISELRAAIAQSPKQVRKGLDKAISFAEKQMAATTKAHEWKEWATGKHNTFEKVQNASVKQGIAQGAFAVGSAAETALMIKSTYGDLDTFRNMIADIKGVTKEEITSGDALFGELPYAGNIARRALLTAAAPRTLLEVINQTFNVRMIMGKHVPIPMFIGVMLGSSAIGQFTSGNILDTYKEMKENEEKGIENDAEHYAKLIGMGYKDIRAREGDASPFAKEVGRYYATRQIPLRQTMQDMLNGNMAKLVKDIKHHNDQAFPVQQADANAAATPTAELNEATHIHANAAAGQHLHHNHNDDNVTDTPAALPEGFANRLTQPPAPTELTRPV